MGLNLIYEQLTGLKHNAPRRSIDDQDKFVIMSDLHLGDGGSGEDALHNEALILTALRGVYLRGRFQLVLNGEVEALFSFCDRAGGADTASPSDFNLQNAVKEHRSESE
jgi:hypothetical protein